MTAEPGERRRGRPAPKLPRGERHTIRREGCEERPPEGLTVALGQFNAGLYWECHESLERLWLEERRDLRHLYQGVLLVGVGLLHLGRRNRHGALTKLASGLELLAPFEPSCLGLDVAALTREAGAVLEALEDAERGLEAAAALPAPRCASASLDSFRQRG